jgi:hypothetical protein
MMIRGRANPTADGTYVCMMLTEDQPEEKPAISYSYSRFREFYRLKPLTQIARIDAPGSVGLPRTRSRLVSRRWSTHQQSFAAKRLLSYTKDPVGGTLKVLKRAKRQRASCCRSEDQGSRPHRHDMNLEGEIKMSKAAISLLVFGIYLVLNGLGFLLIPDPMLGLLGLPAVTEPWARILGMLTLILAYYFIQAARHEMTDFFRFTVHARAAVIVFVVAFVAFGLAQPMMIGFGVVDLLGAIWTAWALRSK